MELLVIVYTRNETWVS